MDSSLLESVQWRCIGPPRGGRVVAVAGDPVDAMVFYFGACAGGVWKTTDGGTYWENVSDGFFKTASVGAIAELVKEKGEAAELPELGVPVRTGIPVKTR